LKRLAISELVECLGKNALDKLSLAFAGAQVYIPVLKSHVPRTKRYLLMIRAIGEEAMKKLMAEHGGKVIYLPVSMSCIEHVISCEDYEKIAKEYAGGTTVTQLAKKYGVGERDIYVSLKRSNVNFRKTRYLYLSEMAECIGEDSVVKILTIISGQTVHIPVLGSKRARPIAVRFIVSAIGEDTMKKLMTEHGGKTIYLPNGCTERLRERYRKIAAEYDGTETLTQIALRYGISNRTVSIALKRHGISPRKTKRMMM